MIRDSWHHQYRREQGNSFRRIGHLSALQGDSRTSGTGAGATAGMSQGFSLRNKAMTIGNWFVLSKVILATSQLALTLWIDTAIVRWRCGYHIPGAIDRSWFRFAIPRWQGDWGPGLLAPGFNLLSIFLLVLSRQVIISRPRLHFLYAVLRVTSHFSTGSLYSSCTAC